MLQVREADLPSIWNRKVTFVSDECEQRNDKTGALSSVLRAAVDNEEVDVKEEDSTFCGLLSRHLYSMGKELVSGEDGSVERVQRTGVAECKDISDACEQV